MAQAQRQGGLGELVQGLAPVGFEASQLRGIELVFGEREGADVLERGSDALEPLGQRRAERSQRRDAAPWLTHDVERIVEQALAVA